MAFVTKTWKDRMVEFAGRRKLKNVSTNESVLYDVSRSEGTVMQAGDSFSATNMNDLEQRIKTEFDNVNSSLGGMKFGKDGDGNCGYYGADGSLIPFKSGTEVAIFMGAKNMVAYNILILSDGTCKNAESTPLIGNKMKVNGSTYTALKSGKFKIVIPRVSTDSTVFTAVEKYVNAGNTIFQGADLGYGIWGSCVYAID